MTQRDLYMAYTKGWRDGASAKETHPDFTTHPEEAIREAYRTGYESGYIARKGASEFASLQYSYHPEILRTMSELEDR